MREVGPKGERAARATRQPRAELRGWEKWGLLGRTCNNVAVSTGGRPHRCSVGVKVQGGFRWVGRESQDAWHASRELSQHIHQLRWWVQRLRTGAGPRGRTASSVAGSIEKHCRGHQSASLCSHETSERTNERASRRTHCGRGCVQVHCTAGREGDRQARWGGDRQHGDVAT